MTTPTRPEPARLYRQLAVAATVLTVGLITLGGVVRITGSGMGCGDHWPLCNGRIFPDLADPLEVIEWSHRWVAAMLSASVLALGWAALRYHGREGRLRNPALLATALLVLQVLLGALTVKLGTAAPAVVIHLGNAMVLLAALMVCVLRSEPAAGDEGPIPVRGTGDTVRTAMLAAGLGFATILLGALVANYNAGLYCLGFPLCGGTLAPPPTTLGRIQWIHRIFAFTLLLSSLSVAARARTMEAPGFRRFRQAAFSVPLLIGAQIAVGTAMVFRLLPTSLRAFHLLIGSLV
ncbi:MAG TPA: COX15/CtaA family protein, partial [Gemmatimonadales bacterium]|nr:COX15/CtaA family protein [Gemmatimonadales bacterium]